MGNIVVLVLDWRQLSMEAHVGEYHLKQMDATCIWKDSLHQPQLQANSSPILQVRIWSTVGCVYEGLIMRSTHPLITAA